MKQDTARFISSIEALLSSNSYRRKRKIVIYTLFTLLIGSMVILSLREGNVIETFLGLLIFSWFSLVIFGLGFILKYPLQRLLWTDLPFVASCLFLCFWNIYFIIRGMNEDVLVYAFALIGFIPLAALYLGLVTIFFVVLTLMRRRAS